MKHKFWLLPPVLVIGMLLLALNAAQSQESTESSGVNKTTAIAPAKSIQSGLLLEPPLDLDWFTREKFVELSSTVGRDKIGKEWTSPVVTLPPHERSGVKGLTEVEIKDYMLVAKDYFSQGKAIPVSDVGLISTQEDVVRQPMLNHIAAFENLAV